MATGLKKIHPIGKDVVSDQSEKGWSNNRYMDAWAGTGARILAMANLYPAWAVTRDMVHFAATEPDSLYAKMTSINCYLYGINGCEQMLNDVKRNEAQLIPVQWS